MKTVLVNGYGIDDATVEKLSTNKVLVNLSHSTLYGTNYLQALAQNSSDRRSVDVLIISGNDIIQAKVKITGVYPELNEEVSVGFTVNLQCECLPVFDSTGNQIGVDFSVEKL
ncbi:hypothetical protein VPHK435_0007 [Vibrio phage K435]